MNERIEIPFSERGLASITHLSGLAGYIFPLGGIVVPIFIYLTKSDSPVIRAIARQAILLNLTVFALACAGVALFFTILLIPAVIVGWVVLGFAALGLPIIGAIKAADGTYYRYPVVGATPDAIVPSHAS
ncbi:MAG: DUF4870 domain-containing protein [Acidobacteriota bacterium]